MEGRSHGRRCNHRVQRRFVVSLLPIIPCPTLVFLAYQLEWSKCYTRSQRWQEEVELLKEEMRRTLEFLKWKSSLWLSKTMTKSGLPLSPELHEGLNAYACQQAAVFESLHDHFLSLWQGLKVPNSSPDQLQPLLEPLSSDADCARLRARLEGSTWRGTLAPGVRGKG